MPFSRRWASIPRSSNNRQPARRRGVGPNCAPSRTKTLSSCCPVRPEPAEMLYFSAIFRRLPRSRPQRACRASVSPPLALLAWLYTYQANKLAWGGARHGGKRRPAPQAALPRWVRIFSITTGSSIQAMILTGPPQLLQVSMSMLNTRFRRCAQVMAARR